MKSSSNLSKLIYDCLKTQSVESAARWKKTNNINPSLMVEDQIASANNYWRLQLGQLRANTITPRSYLQDHLSVDQWIANFQKHVVPTIVRYNLPT